MTTCIAIRDKDELPVRHPIRRLSIEERLNLLTGSFLNQKRF